jgi:predicted amidohydrolase
LNELRHPAAGLRAGIYQGPEAAGPPDAMLAAMARAAAQAAADGVGLLVMPELFLTGYNIGADALRALAEPQDGASARQAAAIARQHGIALLYGYPEQGNDGAIYNSALLIGRDGGPCANFRKLHLFGDKERAVFTPGSVPFILAETGGLRLGLLICYDVEFPEMVRGLALRGAQVACVPTALMHPYGFVPEILVRSRAYENQMFVIYANRTGREDDLLYAGASCIIGPDGQELSRAGAGEQLIAADLDISLLARSAAFNSYFADRRPELYADPAPLP